MPVATYHYYLLWKPKSSSMYLRMCANGEGAVKIVAKACLSVLRFPNLQSFLFVSQKNTHTTQKLYVERILMKSEIEIQLRRKLFQSMLYECESRRCNSRSCCREALHIYKT